MAKTVVHPLILLGEMRGKLSTEALKLPGPDPLKNILREVDQLAGRIESQLKSGALVLQREETRLRGQFYEEIETGIDLGYPTERIASNLLAIVKGMRKHIILDLP